VNADQEALRIEQGANSQDPSGFEQGWFSRIRARKRLGDNVNKGPFTRQWGNVKVAASPMNQDKNTAIADAVGWRRVATESAPVVPAVVDVGDILLIQWEYFKLTADPKILAQAVANANIVKPWPAGYPGAASFEVGT
jgi:hypothetical protein